MVWKVYLLFQYVSTVDNKPYIYVADSVGILYESEALLFKYLQFL